MATALTSLVTRVGYRIGITPGAATIPSSTEITQWLKDAQRRMLFLLPPSMLNDRVVSETVALVAATYNHIDPTNELVKLLDCVWYDSSATTNYNCKIINIAQFNNIRYTENNLSLVEKVAAFDPETGYVRIAPAGAVSDTLKVNYIQDIDTTDTDYELDAATEEMAVAYAAYIASMQLGDYLNLGQKFYAEFNDYVKEFERLRQ